MNYSAAIKKGDGQQRWAVFCAITRAWYFPTIPGKKAAQNMAENLNRLDTRPAPTTKYKWTCMLNIAGTLPIEKRTVIEATNDMQAARIAARRWNTTPEAIHVFRTH